MDREKIESIMEKTSKGQILARAIIEIAGKPKEHVEKTLDVVIQKIKENQGIKIVEHKKFDVEQKEGIFTGFQEAGLLFRDPSALFGFCFDFMPSSIEILEPEEFKVKANDLAGLVNDLLAKLHEVTAASANIKFENNILKRDMVSVIKNIILILLSAKEFSLEELSKTSGVPEQDLKPLLESMIKENKISLNEGLYKLER